MPFSGKALDFLFENRINDSKQWYAEHKDAYTEFVVKPCAEFILKMQPAINEIDPVILCSPKRISRIYRDTRFSKNKSIFRDYVWVTFGQRRENHELPSFYFSFSPNGFEYGCGYYCATPQVMDAYRELILKRDRSYSAARKAIDKSSVFTLGGDLYKRNHFPDSPENDRDWLNRRNIFATAASTDFNLLFSEALAEKISADFLSLEPFYKFLMQAEDIAMKTEIRPQ